MLHASCSVLGATCFALHFPADWACLCPLFSLLLRCTLFSWRSWFHEALLASHTLTDISCTQTHILDKRVFLNMLSSVSIMLLAFLRSAFHRHFTFLLQTPADRRSFFSVSAFSWSIFSFHIHSLLQTPVSYRICLVLISALSGGWGFQTVSLLNALLPN